MTLLEIINRTTEFFQKKGVDSPRLQIELLLAHVLKLPRMQLYLQFERELTEAELDTLRPLVKRRSEREPLQYLTGLAHFHSMDLFCESGALIPRPETELLVEVISKDLKNAATGTLADVGTGSGCIALALAQSLPGWHIIGIDRMESALNLARKNGGKYPELATIEWKQGDLLQDHDGPLDVVVSNLPYLTSKEMGELQPELAHEPASALHGGEDGLDLIRQLIAQIPDCTGTVYLEIGIAQAETVCDLLKNSGFSQCSTIRDFNGYNRFVKALR